MLKKFTKDTLPGSDVDLLYDLHTYVQLKLDKETLSKSELKFAKILFFSCLVVKEWEVNIWVTIQYLYYSRVRS